MIGLKREVITRRDIRINVTMRKSWEQNYDRNIQIVRGCLIIVNLSVIAAILGCVP